MQFSDPYQQLYTDVIQPACKEFGLRAYHVGDVPGPGVILHDIAQGLVEAEIVIAEITPINQNVFYELGYAHALGKPTILALLKRASSFRSMCPDIDASSTKTVSGASARWTRHSVSILPLSFMSERGGQIV